MTLSLPTNRKKPKRIKQWKEKHRANWWTEKNYTEGNKQENYNYLEDKIIRKS